MRKGTNKQSDMPVQQRQDEERTGLSSDNQAVQERSAVELLGENRDAAIATTSTAMVNYGMSNEGGQLLARELLARELQARELLAREMGSQTESTRKRIAGATGRSLRSRSGNVSLDGSSIVSRRSRWTLAEPAVAATAAAVKQQERSSLPAEFLYFKFEQMVARWINQKTMSTVLSMERYGPRLLLNNSNGGAGQGPPRTITTTTIQNEPRKAQHATAAPALALSPSHTTSIPSIDDSNVPRFMRNTTTSVGHSVVQAAATSTPPRASNNNKNHARQRSRTPSKTPVVNNRKKASTPTRRRPSPSPVRNARRESSSPQQPRNRTTRTRTGPNSLRNAPQLQKTQGSTKKKKDQARKTQVSQQHQHQQQQDETRSPLETTELNDAQHYFIRETSIAAPHMFEDEYQEQDVGTNNIFNYQTTPVATEQVPEKQSKPDPEGPTPNTRPDPEGDRNFQHHIKVTASSPPQQQLKISLPPTPRSPSPARTNHFASPTAAATGHQVVAGAKGSPSRAKTPTISKTTGTRRNTSTSPTKRRASPSPRRTPQQSKAPNSAGNSSRRRQSRLPPLPSFKAGSGTTSSSPSPQQQRKRSSSLGTQNKRQPGSPTTRTKNSPQRGGKRTVTKPDPPKLRQYKRVHFRAIKMLQRFGRMVPARRRFLALRSSVVQLQSLLRRKLQIQAFRKAIRGTRLQKFASIVIQKNYRRITCQSSYIQLQHAIVVVQSAIRMFACRSTFIELRSASKKLLGRCPIREAPSTPKPLVATIKGGRLRIYSALLIQSLVRMQWVRAAFLELRGSAIVLQKWFRKVHRVIKKQNAAATVIQNWAQTLSWRACFLDLRVSVILLQKWTRQVCVRSRYIRQKQQNAETASTLVIQRRWRRAACRSAYSQLRSSALVLQQWARSRIQVIKLCRAALVVQCRIRQLRSERAVYRLRSAVVVKTAYRSFGSTMRVHTCNIQACIRGYLYRTSYLSLRLAAIVAQKRFRGKQACAFVTVRRAALFKETTKQKRSKMNEVIEKPKPDPVVGNEIMHASLLGAPQPGDTLKTIDTRGVGHNCGVMSAALANVAQSPSVRSTTPRRFRHASPSTNGINKSFFPSGNQLDRAQSAQNRTQPREATVVNEPSSSNSFTHSFPVAMSKNTAAVEPSETKKIKTPRSGPRDPAGENMSRKPPPLPFEQNFYSAHGDYSDPKTPSDLYMSSPPPPPPPPQPRPPKQHKVKNVHQAAPNAGIQSLRSDPLSSLIPAPGDGIARILPEEMLPSGESPYLVPRSAVERSMESSKLDALQPSTEKIAQQEQPPYNPYLYLAPPSQLANKFPIGGTIMPRLGPASKFERGIIEESQLASKPDSLERPNVPPVPSISDNPRYYLPTKSAKKDHKSIERETSLVSNVEIPQEKADNAVAPRPTANPLKKILHSRHSDEYLMSIMKKEDDTTDKAIGEKLVTMKHRSTRSRKMRRSRSALKKGSTIPSVDLKEQAKKEQREALPNINSRPNMEKKDSSVNPMERWAKETLQTRKNSLFTSVLDDESATLIQSVWRSRRDQLRLAGLLLKTWSVSCELQSEDFDDDGVIRQNAHILALDGAFRQLGYDWQACNLLIKKGLTMVQWEGLVSIEFLKLGLAGDDTFHTRVSVHCTGVESNLLRAWNEDRRCTLLVKAAITKHCDDHIQCSSVFEKSLTSKSTDTASVSDPVTSSDQLVASKQGSPWTDPPDIEEYSSGEDIIGQKDLFREFRGRISGSAAILIQSWYRMCVCRRMYRGLQRIQSRVLLGRTDDSETHFFQSTRHTCETIVEEKEGFEVNSSSAEEE